MEKLEVKKSFARSRPRWEFNTKIHLIKNWGLKSCIAFYLVQER